MNAANRNPADSALNDNPNGLNHPAEILIAWSPADPAYTFTNATTQNTSRIVSSAPSNRYCVRADHSMPRQAIQVISRIHSEPATITASLLAAQPCAPTSWNV